MRRATVLLAIAASLPLGAAWSAGTTPETVADHLAAHGPKATVDMLTAGRDASGWQTVLRGVRRGDARWLGVAKDLAPGADAADAEALRVSVATALPTNPAGVLRLVDTTGSLSVAQLCSAPFIEPTRSFLLRYLQQARTALGKLHDPTVESQRVACLRTVESTLAAQRARPQS